MSGDEAGAAEPVQHAPAGLMDNARLPLQYTITT
jgi:hypothetical protein